MTKSNGRVRERSQWRLALRRLVRHKMAFLGGVILLLVLLGALLAPIVAPYDPIDMDLPSRFGPPSASHPLGTDFFGRDILSRILFGARISLAVGFSAVGWSALVGIPIGLYAGYFEGMLGNVLMRAMDALMSFPPLLLAIAVSGTMGGGEASVVFALGLVYVPVFARLVRGSTLSLREEVYIMAARSFGAPDARIVLRHIMPNLVAIIVVQATLSFVAAVVSEATLSFLGLGVPPPAPSWGRDLNDGRAYLRQAWWIAIVPAVTIVGTVLGINFLGDGLRDALDPRMRTRV